ncbi:MAG TPA: TMEM165/GDT1 family protein [Streptosporangiaceae bacterium]
MDETFADESGSSGGVWPWFPPSDPDREGPCPVPGAALLATVFAVTFVVELPDKSLFASLLLGTRYQPWHVWLGVMAAFAVHVGLAVTAGSLLTVAPHWVVELVSTALFLGGAAWMLKSRPRDTSEPGPDAARIGAPPPSLLRVTATSFAVVFAGEWGDITQVTTANFAARYQEPLIVGVAAVIALWAVSGLAVFVGPKVLGRIPERSVRVAAAVALTGFGLYSLSQAVMF